MEKQNEIQKIKIDNQIINNTKISIIIPVYNCEKYLKQCLDSIINQTLKEIEVICVNDGSTDKSLEILQDYTQKDSRIKIINQKNMHAGIARNNGMKYANGKYIHFLDADDWIDLNTYEELYKIIENSDADFAKFRAYSYNNQTGEITSRPYLDISSVKEKFFDNNFSLYTNPEETVKLPDAAWMGIYKRKFLKDNNLYFDDFICANDVGFFYRCIIAAKKIYLSPKRFVYYREKNKDSLIYKRGKFFDCQIKSYEAVKNASATLPDNIQSIVLNQIIKASLNWYLECRDEYNLTLQEKKHLKKLIEQFIKQISLQYLNGQNTDLKKKICKQDKIHLSNRFFSFRKEYMHYVLSLFGIQFKFKINKI